MLLAFFPSYDPFEALLYKGGPSRAFKSLFICNRLAIDVFRNRNLRPFVALSDKTRFRCPCKLLGGRLPFA